MPKDDYWEKRYSSDPDYKEHKKLISREYYEANKPEILRRNREYREKNLDAVRENTRKGVRKFRLKAKYGLTLEEYDAIATLQGNSCKVCKTLDKGHAKDWSVDHCHKTGEVRGLLCHKCNTALGLAREDPDILRALADYIEGHNGNLRQRKT